MNNYYKGYDISIMQGIVPFQKLADMGTKFIISRCAVGNNGTDINYAKNIKGTKDAGMLAAAYNFAFPLPKNPSQPTRDPVIQAQMHFKASAGELSFLDLEWPMQPDWQKWGCSASQIVDWTLQYLAEYERLCGKKIPIYTYPNFMQTIGNPEQFKDYPLWIASYQATPYIPKPWNDWQIWQNSGGTEHLPTGAAVDGDWAKSLSLWGVQDSAPTSPPNPIPNVVSTPVAPTPDPATQAPTAPVLAPPSAPPTEPAPQPMPSPARPPHPQAPLSAIESLIAMIVKLLKALLHI